MFANGIVNHEQCAMRIVDIVAQTKEENRFFICSGPTRSSFRDALNFARLSFRCVSSFPSVYRSLPTAKATSPVPSTPTIPIILLNPTAISSGHQPFNKVTRPRRRISLVVPGI